MYNIILIFSALLTFLIMYKILYFKYQENLNNINPTTTHQNRTDTTDIITTTKDLPIKSNYKSNYDMNNYDESLFVNPKRYKGLIGDPLSQKENEYSGIQPKNMYFDIFNVNCSQPYKRPWACLLYQGNYVNNIPKKYCRTVCPDRFINSPKEKSFKIEGFKNFQKTPNPSHFYCRGFCGKGCSKHKYNPIDPTKNTCGQNGFSQVPLPIYTSQAECIKDSFPCDSLNKKQCLGNPKCGWCTNGIGEGHCFRSTPEGPFNLKLPCAPSRQKPTNAFKPGRLDPFEGIVQFQPHPLAPFQKK